MTSAASLELLPCPKCGSRFTQFLEGKRGLHKTGVYVWCSSCGISDRLFTYDPLITSGKALAKEQAAAAWNTRTPATPDSPIPMLLYCPKCGLQHVDAPDERTPNWQNPPHRSHLCHGCGCIWRPADVATDGVKAIETRGKADTWTPTASLSLPTSREAKLDYREIALAALKRGRSAGESQEMIARWISEDIRQALADHLETDGGDA